VSTINGVILVRAECVRCPWLLAQTKVATIFITFLMEYNLTEPEYNLPEPEYNLPEPEYNLPEPEYILTEPEYNRPDPLYSYHRYSKPQKGLSYCFKFLHGPLKKMIKIWVNKKFDPPPPWPPGGDF
jgi:hypothetical protein